jgi:GT2 family glycosyltransferase
MHRVAYVVPTKDRPDDLRKMLRSLVGQTRRPDQVIVVDGSSEPVQCVVEEFPELAANYVRVFPPGLAKQRNAGMAVLRPEISVAGYLDDDLVLEPDATEKMMKFFEDARDDVGGAAFSIINQPAVSTSKAAEFFLLSDTRPGKMLRSGFQSQIPFVRDTVETDWLYGGATLWRREVIREYSYDEWYVGTGFLEDVDYSFRVRQKFRLFVVGNARVYHYSRPIALERNFLLGRHQVVNRTYFVRKMRKFSNAAFAWSITGQFFHNLMSSVARRNTAGIRRAMGNLAGLTDLLSGRTQISGHYK